MFWIIIIGVLLFVGWLILKGIGENDTARRLVWRESILNKAKSTVIKNHSEQVKRIESGENTLYTSKSEKEARIVDLKSEIEAIKLWDRHITTVQVSDIYSAEAKANAIRAWFDYLTSYEGIIDRIGYGADDLYEQRDYKIEMEEKLYGVLEAFGYDAEKEYKEIQVNLKKQYKLKK